MAINYKQRWQEVSKELDRIAVVVDLAGIARHMKVARSTPQQWRQRGHLPDPDFPEITDTPLWYASTIKREFCEPTGRIWYDDPDAAEELPDAA